MKFKEGDWVVFTQKGKEEVKMLNVTGFKDESLKGEFKVVKLWDRDKYPYDIMLIPGDVRSVFAFDDCELMFSVGQMKLPFEGGFA